MKEDTHTRTESDAAHVARDLGRNQAISNHHEPVTTPFCSTCQGGTKAYVCGPCERWGGAA